VPAQLADVPITVEILPEAQRVVDEADERWVAEHGFLADNPLLDEILHASDRLRTNPQIGVVVRRARFEIRRANILWKCSINSGYRPNRSKRTA
jgi:hypothetical protein